MPDYIEISDEFKPTKVELLLIAEAPPTNENSYFYIPYNIGQTKTRRKDSSLPATIFYHYFDRLPKDKDEYLEFLNCLCKNGIFLIDISDIPLNIRDNHGINENNLNILISEIPKLKNKIKDRIGIIKENKIKFLLPRNHYIGKLQELFPESQYFSWVDFRMQTEIINNCK